MVKGVFRVLMATSLFLALAKEKVATGTFSFVPEGFRVTTLAITEADAKADFMQRGKAIDIAVAVNSPGSKPVVLVRNILIVSVFGLPDWSDQSRPSVKLLMTPEQADAIFMSDSFVFARPRIVFTSTSPLFIQFQVIEKHGCRCLFEEVRLKHVEADFCQFKWRGLNCL